jgi:hypothetical protein
MEMLLTVSKALNYNKESPLVPIEQRDNALSHLR